MTGRQLHLAVANSVNAYSISHTPPIAATGLSAALCPLHANAAVVLLDVIEETRSEPPMLICEPASGLADSCPRSTPDANQLA